MRSKTFWALAALNVALATVLTWKMVGSEPTAQAQAARPSDYLMIPARVVGASNGIVFVLDTNQQALSAMYYDENNKRMEAMAPLPLARIFEQGMGVGAGRAPAR